MHPRYYRVPQQMGLRLRRTVRITIHRSRTKRHPTIPKQGLDGHNFRRSLRSSSLSCQSWGRMSDGIDRVGACSSKSEPFGITRIGRGYRNRWFHVSLGVGFLAEHIFVFGGSVLAHFILFFLLLLMMMTTCAPTNIIHSIGLIVGFVFCSILMSVVGSAVNTVIVCYAESPAEFQQNHPQLSTEMRTAWMQAWPELAL